MSYFDKKGFNKSIWMSTADSGTLRSTVQVELVKAKLAGAVQFSAKHSVLIVHGQPRAEADLLKWSEQVIKAIAPIIKVKLDGSRATGTFEKHAVSSLSLAPLTTA